MLIVVRHAQPAVDPAAPPAVWPLDAAGRVAAMALAASLPPGALLVASVEPKARETLAAAGTAHVDARFNEVARPDEPFADDFRERRAAYVGGADHPGWERRADVANRFDAGVRHWCDSAAGRPLVIASHGMAMTLWLTAAIGLPDPAEFWRDLRLPDPYLVDLESHTAQRFSPTRTRSR